MAKDMMLVARSRLSPANPNCFARLGTQRCNLSLLRISSNPALRRLRLRSCFCLEISGSGFWKHGFRRRIVQVRAMDEGHSSLDDREHDNDILIYRHLSSEVEESDGDNLLNPVSGIDLAMAREPSLETNDAFNGTANRLARITRVRRKSRFEGKEIKRRLVEMVNHGVIINIGLMTFLTILLLLVDCCAWRIVKLPLEPFYMTRPFCISAVVVSCAGYVCVPLFRSLKICSVIRREGPAWHSSKKGTPTMGGLVFVPIGIFVAEVSVGFCSIEVRGAAVATLAFAAIGLLDDVLSIIKNHNYGLSASMKIFLEVAVGSMFSVWLETTKISSPYSMKMLVPLPAPLGLVCLGKCYPLLTSFCFVSMTNGINLTDGLDGLAGGTAALAFIGMSIAVLPICSDLSVFGASMAGACVGFLSHNRYKASVFMGDVGSLALGGALAAIASGTGMFLPLFISSGIFVLEAVSVIMQVSFFKTTKRLQGRGRRLFRMAPFHHHLELCGIKEPIIVAAAYMVSSLLALLAGYVGLISA